MFDGMNKQKKLERAKTLFTTSVTADTKWQREAKEDFAFRDGYQWTATEKRILQDEMRPVLTFNLTKSSVDLIMGMNEDNKQVMRCSPVDPTDGFLCEVLNDLTYWIQENNRFSDEEDDALESAATAGRGYVGIDFAPDPKRFGEIVMKEINIPVHEIHFDPSARKKDLSDAAYIFWDRWFKPADFKIKYPKTSNKKIEDFISYSKGQNTLSPTTEQRPYEGAFDIPTDISSDTSDYSKPMDTEFYDSNSNMIRVVHMEYWAPYQRNFLFIPDEKQWEEITNKDTKEVEKAFNEAYPQAEFIIETMMDKKVKWLQFIGTDILYDDDSPLPYTGFSICPTFVYADASKRTANHYGIVRLMKDPQREVNKRWSQALNMLNQQVQPGIFAETDAFVDMKQAEQSMKEAGSITWVNSGAIAGGKIKERTVPKFPDAPMQMEQYSQDIIKKITGINPDLLGQDRGRQDPGVVIRLRQQQGMTLLKPLFKAFNNMKKDLFLRQLSIVMEYMPDQQMLRILGSTERYTIDQNGIITDKLTNAQANIRDVKNLEYNVVTEEAAGNMTKRMLELSALMEMQKGGFPVDPIQVIEKMNLPESDKARWMQYIEQQQQGQQQQQEMMLKLQMGVQDREFTIQEKKLMMDFLVSIAKIKQMAEKDEKKMVDNAASRKVQIAQSAMQAQTQDRQMRGDIMMQLLDLAKQYEGDLEAARTPEQGGQPDVGTDAQ
jgi:hypothetical protein